MRGMFISILGKIVNLVLVLALIFSILPLQAGWAMGKRARRQNIVFILADDLGWSDLGCYGNRTHMTPNIDGIASDGMRFTNFYVAAACMPTRVGLLTGKNPNRTADLYGAKQPCLFSPWTPLDPGEVTYADVLKAEGYATGHIGKWGVRHWKDEGEKAQGFDKCYFTQDWYFLPNYHFPYFENENHFMDLAQGENRGYLVDGMTDSAEQFLEENKDRPFILTLSHFAVHIPVEGQGKKELVEKYRAKAAKTGAEIHPDYAAIVESLDQSTGRVLAKLRELGLEDRTIVVFLSDNGGFHRAEIEGGRPITSNAPLREGKATIYEGGIRVPLIVKWPGVVKPGTVSNALGTVEDFYPTVLEMAGAKVPRGRKIDGVSIVPVLRGMKTQVRNKVFLQWQGFMVRQGKYKLIEFPPYVPTSEEIDSARKKAEKKKRKFKPPESSSLKIELYDLSADIGETRNIASERPEIVRVLRRELHDWLKEMHGPENYTLERAKGDAEKLGQEYPEP